MSHSHSSNVQTLKMKAENKPAELVNLDSQSQFSDKITSYQVASMTLKMVQSKKTGVIYKQNYNLFPRLDKEYGFIFSSTKTAKLKKVQLKLSKSEKREKKSKQYKSQNKL